MGPRFGSRTRAAAMLALAGSGAPLGTGGLKAQIQAPAGQLVYAVYQGRETAAGVFGRIEPALAADRSAAYAVVSKDLSGQVAIQKQLGGTLGRSAFLGGLVALLGPSGGQGEAGATGVDTLRAALAPGTSGIFALVDAGRMDAVTAMLQPSDPEILGVTVVGPTVQATPSEGPGIRASPPVHSTVTGYTPGTDYEPGVGIETGTGYTPGVGIEPDTADFTADSPDDRR